MQTQNDCHLKLNHVHPVNAWCGSRGTQRSGGDKRAKIRDEWLSRWGIMGSSPLSEGMASRGNSEEDRFRPDEKGSWLSTLLLCVGSGSASKSSTRWGELSKARGGAGEVRRGETMNGGEIGEKEMTEKEKRDWKGGRGGRTEKRLGKEIWAENYDFPLCPLIWPIQCNQVIANVVFTCHVCTWLFFLSCRVIIFLSHSSH